MRTAVALALFAAALASGQTSTESAPVPAFEVATIKPSDPAKCCDRTFSRQGRHFASYNTYLKWLIQYSYELQASQVIPAPAWADHGWFEESCFDVTGTIDGQYTPTPHQWLVAIQNLLNDRFQLKFHHETRELPAYVLTIAKGGPKLEPGDGIAAHTTLSFGGSPGQTMRGFGNNATLGEFLGQLQRLALDRPIVNRTGLTGTYNMQLTFFREPVDSVGVTQIPDNSPPNVFGALQQQLGLKLEPVKSTAVDVLVIDHAERPSPN